MVLFIDVEIVSPRKVINLLQLEWVLLTVWASVAENHSAHLWSNMETRTFKLAITTGR